LNHKTKVGLGTGGLTALALFGVLMISSVPVTYAGSGPSVPLSVDGVPVQNACAQVFDAFPPAGDVVFNIGSGYSGYHLRNLTLSTSFDYWLTWNNGSFYQAGNYTVNGQTYPNWKQHNETTTTTVYVDAESLAAGHDNATLARGKVIVSINGSVDSVATAYSSRLALSQYNSTTIRLEFTALSLQATIGPYMAKALHLPVISASMTNFQLAMFANCVTGKTQYQVGGDMGGLSAIGAMAFYTNHALHSYR
jgi:hypothetical protein